jgi:hypothetical protein
MKVLAIRGYHMTPYGMQTAGEVWANSEEGPSGLHPRFANQTRESLSEMVSPMKRHLKHCPEHLFVRFDLSFQLNLP